MRQSVSWSLCVCLLSDLVACSPHPVSGAFGPAPKCEVALAPRISVRPAVTMSGLAVLVLDASTNGPLPQARIGVLENSWGAYTDSTGFARLARLTTGSYTIRIRAIGYKSVDDTLIIPPGGGRFLIVQLSRDLFCFPYPL